MTTTVDSVSATAVTMAGALNTALGDALAADRRVVVFGEDVGTLGGVFRVTDGLAERFGEDRVFDTPLAEAGIVGTAIGMAMNGLRPVVEMQFDAFAYPAFEQITSHLAKLHNRTRGAVSLPIVVRIPYGGGIGGVEHHCDSSEVYYAHTPGLRVVTPASPADAYRLLRQSIDCPDPVIFLEPKRRYWSKEAAELTSAGPAIDQADGRAAGHRRDPDQLRRNRGHGPGGGGRGGRGRLGRRGHRPAQPLPRRRPDPDPLGPADRPRGRHSRGRRILRLRRRDRRPADRTLLPLPAGAHLARDRVRHPLPGAHARRATTCRAPIASSTRSPACSGTTNPTSAG